MNNDNNQLSGGGAVKKENRPVMIRNRDIPLLADVLPIMQEVCQIERQRDWQHDRMANITQHLTGMPGGSRIPKGLDEAFAMLSEIDEQHEEKCKDYVRQLKAAQKILNDIESQSMRAFVLMKYVMDISDVDIRQELNLTRRGFERARRSVEEAESMSAVKWHERYILTKD